MGSIGKQCSELPEVQRAVHLCDQGLGNYRGPGQAVQVVIVIPGFCRQCALALPFTDQFVQAIDAALPPSSGISLFSKSFF